MAQRRSKKTPARTNSGMSARADEIHARLRAAPQKKGLDYPTAMEWLGLSVPDLRAIVRDVSRTIRKEESTAVLELAHALIGGGTFEGRQAAYEIVAGHRPTLEGLGARALEALGKGMDNWCSVDTFGCQLSGVVWLRGGLSDAAVDRWARSRNLWWRRAALVSTVPLNMKSRGGSGDTARTLRICEALVADHEDMIVKALSWALRSLVEWDEAAVERFTEQHADALAKRVLREVRNKLETGRKNR